MSKGYIYIMTNPALKDMVKIGYASDVETRRKQLSTTALPYEYEVFATYETSGNLEDKKLHKMIDNLNPDLRVSSNREFFIMTPDEAYELLEAIAVISGTKDKLKKVKTTTRHFRYYYLRYEGQTAIHQRGAGDIWQGLWEPLLVDDGQVPSWLEALRPRLLLTNVKHVLTHQTLFADFYLVTIDHRPSLPAGYCWIDEHDISHYAVPRLVERLLNSLRQ